jgi:hypothetical protein
MVLDNIMQNRFDHLGPMLQLELAQWMHIPWFGCFYRSALSHVTSSGRKNMTYICDQLHNLVMFIAAEVFHALLSVRLMQELYVPLQFCCYSLWQLAAERLAHCHPTIGGSSSSSIASWWAADRVLPSVCPGVWCRLFLWWRYWADPHGRVYSKRHVTICAPSCGG